MKNIKIKKIIKKNWHLGLIFLLAITFFIGAGSYNFFVQDFSNDNTCIKWDSPDESANYIFAKLFAQENKLVINEDYNLYTNDIMHPRSFRSDFGALKPVSFLGIILIYGRIAGLTTYKILPFLSPLAAAIGIIYFYLLVKKIFGGTNAFLSAFLLAGFPVYIYFSARSMFHNILFVVLLIISLYYAVLTAQKTKKDIKFISFSLKKINYLGLFYAALAGLFFGLAAITRSSELIWMLPLLIILWLFNIKKISICKILIFISFVLLAVMPALYYNQILYSSPYLGGYSEMNQSIINIKDAGARIISQSIPGKFADTKEQITKIKNSILFFGLDYKQSLRMFYYYFIDMFPALFYAGALGFLVFFTRWKKVCYKHIVYIVGLAAVSVILVFYYGSWEFFDNPDKASHTIGNSYTRYWLPVYLGFIPFMSFLIIRLTSITGLLLKKNDVLEKIEFLSFKTSRKFFSLTLRVIILSIVIFAGINFTLTGSAEGLVFLAGRQLGAGYELERVTELTETNAAVITQHHDKLFFPERKVIVGLFDDKNMISQYANLAVLLPVYYYNFSFPDKDIDYLNDRRLIEFGLEISEVEKITSDFTLYKLSPRPVSTSTAEF